MNTMRDDDGLSRPFDQLADDDEPYEDEFAEDSLDEDDFDDEADDDLDEFGDGDPTAEAPARAVSEEEAAEIGLLIDIMPPQIGAAVREHGLAGLIEVVLDLGRKPTARY